MANKKKAPQTRRKLTASQIVRACLREVRAALPPEQQGLITEQNLAERIADLVKIAGQLQQARQARGVLKAMGLG